MWFCKVKNYNKEIFVNRILKILLSTKSVDKCEGLLKNRLNFISLITWWFLAITNVAYAVDLGRVANTFVIKEKNPVTLIQERYNKMSDYEKQQHSKEIIKRTEDWVTRPPGVKLPRAVKNRKFFFNPSIRVTKDIVVDYKELDGYPEEAAIKIKKILGEDGRVLVPKGLEVNPLKIYSNPQPLLFFDSDDLKQVEWFKKQKGIAVLTNGEQIEFSKDIGQQVYFDQHGLLVKRFRITHVPARVSVVNDKLLIEEIAV